jgi:signal transduction histidine kinase
MARRDLSDDGVPARVAHLTAVRGGGSPRAAAEGWAVAHDLAGGVRGIVQLCALVEAKGDDLAPDTLRLVRAIGERARRLQLVVRDLVQTGREPPARHVADPAAVVREVVADLEPELAGLRPRLHLGALPPLAVTRTDLTRLFANLIGNALQHRSAVKPRIEIAARTAGAMVELTLDDNGRGIPPELHATLFAPTGRRPASTAGGNGLGLAICRDLVEAYGGWIRVEPAGGGGSRFRFTLPAAAPAGG